MSKDKKVLSGKRVHVADIEGYFRDVHQEVYSYTVQKLRLIKSTMSRKYRNWMVVYLGKQLTTLYGVHQGFDLNISFSTRGDPDPVLKI